MPNWFFHREKGQAVYCVLCVCISHSLSSGEWCRVHSFISNSRRITDRLMHTKTWTLTDTLFACPSFTVCVNSYELQIWKNRQLQCLMTLCFMLLGLSLVFFTFLLSLHMSGYLTATLCSILLTNRALPSSLLKTMYRHQRWKEYTNILLK